MTWAERTKVLSDDDPFSVSNVGISVSFRVGIGRKDFFGAIVNPVTLRRITKTKGQN